MTSLDHLRDRYAAVTAEELLEDLIRHRFPGEVALVSSFGTESAVLLHMVSRIDPATPVLFLDTGKLFGETLRYRDQLVARLGLTDVRSLKPEPGPLEAEDKDGLLFHRDADRCCFLRKVVPLEQGLQGFSVWINGRKGHHGGDRTRMPMIEQDGARLKATPLANWDADDVRAYFEAHALPRHPLEADGFLSVGCYTCTARATVPGDVRSGRWAGQSKTECGIHTRTGEAAQFVQAWSKAS